MAHYKFRNILVSIVFLGLIFFPFINGKVWLLKDIENTENRQPAAKPEFDIKHLDAYPGNFDKYYSDNFTLRQRFIKYYNNLNLVVFKKSPVPDQVIIGDDGWLFSAGNEIDAYRGKRSLSTDELEAFRLELEYRKQYLEERGCEFYFLVAPVKHNIYHDYLPASFFRLSKKSWGEQLIDYLSEKSSIKLINIYHTFQQSKKHGLMYFKLDNHWNKKGAFFAAQEVLNCLREDFPLLDTLSYSDYTIKDSISHGGNIAGMLSNTQLFTDSVFELVPKGGFKSEEYQKVGYPPVEGFPYPWEHETVRVIKGSDKPKILIISDSFGGNIFPYISDSFGRSVKIFDSWQYKLNEDIVNAEKPDVVLLIVLEANLRNMLEHQSRLKK